MNSAPPQPVQPPNPSAQPSGPATSVGQLPPEAIALAHRLFDAARDGDENSTALLTQALARGLPANLTNDKGDSLIMLAAYKGHPQLVRLLLRYGADPNRLNDRGQSPLAGVVFKHEIECAKALLEGGADPELGEPSALAATEVFKQEEFKSMFLEQIESLKASRGANDYGVPVTSAANSAA